MRLKPGIRCASSKLFNRFLNLSRFQPSCVLFVLLCTGKQQISLISCSLEVRWISCMFDITVVQAHTDKAEPGAHSTAYKISLQVFKQNWHLLRPCYTGILWVRRSCLTIVYCVSTWVLSSVINDSGLDSLIIGLFFFFFFKKTSSDMVLKMAVGWELLKWPKQSNVAYSQASSQLRDLTMTQNTHAHILFPPQNNEVFMQKCQTHRRLCGQKIKEDCWAKWCCSKSHFMEGASWNSKDQAARTGFEDLLLCFKSLLLHVSGSRKVWQGTLLCLRQSPCVPWVNVATLQKLQDESDIPYQYFSCLYTAANSGLWGNHYESHILHFLYFIGGGY